MLTLRELKDMAEIPPSGQRTPTAKELRLSGKPIAERRIGADAGIAAYRNGYAVYRAGGAATVFRIHPCGGYCYGSGESRHDIDGGLFDGEVWHLRLVLEGEDRLFRNREARAREWSVSYSAASEEWGEMGSGAEPVLERLVHEENVDALFSVLSVRQRQAAALFYLEQKTEREIAAELGITASTVSELLARAVDRMRRNAACGKGVLHEEPERRCV